MPSKSSKSLIYEYVYMPSKSPEDPSNLNILLSTTKKEMKSNIPVYTQKYPTYPEIPENTRHSRKYPRVKKIHGNTWSYISTLLPDLNPTRYPVFCPIPDLILKNPTRWALLNSLQVVSKQSPSSIQVVSTSSMSTRLSRKNFFF